MTPPTHPTPMAAARAAAEKKAVTDALIAARGHRQQAAEALGISPRTLHRRLSDLFTAEELDALATKHAWPAQTDAALRSRGVAPKEKEAGRK